MNKIETTNIFGWDESIIGDDIWEFLDEIISLKHRLDSDLVAIYINNSKYTGWGATIAYIVGGDAEGGVELELKKLYKELQNKHIKNFTLSHVSNLLSKL